jgi:hypothetical protein
LSWASGNNGTLGVKVKWILYDAKHSLVPYVPVRLSLYMCVV